MACEVHALVFARLQTNNGYGPNPARYSCLLTLTMRLAFEHNPATEHTRYLLLFITNGGGL